MSETLLPQDSFLLYGPWSIFWALLIAVLIERLLRSSYGSGSLKMRKVLSMLFGFTLVVVQFYYISGAIFAKVGTDGWEKDLNLRRWDCYASTKGGKKANSFRDCFQNHGPRCTKAEPCTPCNFEYEGDLRPVSLSQLLVRAYARACTVSTYKTKHPLRSTYSHVFHATMSTSRRNGATGFCLERQRSTITTSVKPVGRATMETVRLRTGRCSTASTLAALSSPVSSVATSATVRFARRKGILTQA